MFHLAGVGDSSKPFRGDKVSLEIGLEIGAMAPIDRREEERNGEREGYSGIPSGIAKTKASDRDARYLLRAGGAEDMFYGSFPKLSRRKLDSPHASGKGGGALQLFLHLTGLADFSRPTYVSTRYYSLLFCLHTHPQLYFEVLHK